MFKFLLMKLHNQRKNKDLEHLEQCRVVEWVRQRVDTGAFAELDLLFAVPNGGKRDIRTAKKLKDEGVRRGVPDLMLPVSRGGYGGLFLEMKVKGGKVSKEQKDFMERVKEQGFFCAVVWDGLEAIELIDSYISGKMGKE